MYQSRGWMVSLILADYLARDMTSLRVPQRYDDESRSVSDESDELARLVAFTGRDPDWPMPGVRVPRRREIPNFVAVDTLDDGRSDKVRGRAPIGHSAALPPELLTTRAGRVLGR